MHIVWSAPRQILHAQDRKDSQCVFTDLTETLAGLATSCHNGGDPS